MICIFQLFMAAVGKQTVLENKLKFPPRYYMAIWVYQRVILSFCWFFEGVKACYSWDLINFFCWSPITNHHVVENSWLGTLNLADSQGKKTTETWYKKRHTPREDYHGLWNLEITPWKRKSEYDRSSKPPWVDMFQPWIDSGVYPSKGVLLNLNSQTTTPPLLARLFSPGSSPRNVAPGRLVTFLLVGWVLRSGAWESGMAVGSWGLLYNNQLL